MELFQRLGWHYGNMNGHAFSMEADSIRWIDDSSFDHAQSILIAIDLLVEPTRRPGSHLQRAKWAGSSTAC